MAKWLCWRMKILVQLWFRSLWRGKEWLSSEVQWSEVRKHVWWYKVWYPKTGFQVRGHVTLSILTCSYGFTLLLAKTLQMDWGTPCQFGQWMGNAVEDDDSSFRFIHILYLQNGSCDMAFKVEFTFTKRLPTKVRGICRNILAIRQDGMMKSLECFQ